MMLQVGALHTHDVLDDALEQDRLLGFVWVLHVDMMSRSTRVRRWKC